MKRITNFVKLTIQGGFLVLLPLLLFIILMGEIIELVEGLTIPIAALLPTGLTKDPEHPLVISILLLVGLSFIIGLVLKSEFAHNLGKTIEEKTLGNLAVYKFVKSLVSGLLGSEKANTFKPAILDTPMDYQQFVYLVEELGDDRCIVLCPTSPTGFAGPLKIVPREKVQLLNATMGELNLVLTHMGFRAGQLLKKGTKET